MMYVRDGSNLFIKHPHTDVDAKCHAYDVVTHQDKASII